VSAGGVPTGNVTDKKGSTNPVVRRMMAGFDAALDASLPAARPGAVLEVGVGEGHVSQQVAERWPDVPIAGIDLPDHELAAHWIGRAHAGAFADIAALPFPDAAFDLVLAIEVLEHVPDPVAALVELRRVARRDLVLSVPREPVWRAANMARGAYLGALGNTPGHVNHWSKRGFVELVGTTFDVREVRSPFPWTMVAATVRA
jgi:SAM-dependent methyltransferase